MAASGDLVIQTIEDTAEKKGGYLLVVEGAIATKDNGVYCEFGERDGHGITILEHLTTLGPDAMAIVALGSCATHGGIPAASPNTTDCKGVKQVLDENGVNTPVINLPGCPPHPDWFVGTLASVLMGGLGSVEMDDAGRPLAFYGKLIHDNCPRRAYFDAGEFAKKYSEPYCLFELGCKGPVTHADCPIRLWNSGTNWCVGSNGPCIGCAEFGFPDNMSPFRKVSELYTVTPPSWLPPVEKEKEAEDFNAGLAAGLGAVGGIAAGAAAATAIAKQRAKPKEETED